MTCADTVLTLECIIDNANPVTDAKTDIDDITIRLCLKFLNDLPRTTIGKIIKDTVYKKPKLYNEVVSTKVNRISSQVFCFLIFKIEVLNVDWIRSLNLKRYKIRKNINTAIKINVFDTERETISPKKLAAIWESSIGNKEIRK